MPSQRHITVRRAPKYFPFLVAGGLLGAIVAAIVGYTGTVPDGYTRESLFGYFLVLFAAAGVLVGGVVVLILDRVSVARAQKAIVEEVPDEADNEAAEAAEDQGDKAVEGPGAEAADDDEQGPGAS